MAHAHRHTKTYDLVNDGAETRGVSTAVYEPVSLVRDVVGITVILPTHNEKQTYCVW